MLSSAASRAARLSKVIFADSEKRSRSVPGGTVGVRIGNTLNPFSRSRPESSTALCGLPTLLGAWLGFWLGDIGPIGLACSLGFASGAMLYVVYGEILPEAYLIYKSKAPAFAAMCGILLGLVLIF